MELQAVDKREDSKPSATEVEDLDNPDLKQKTVGDGDVALGLFPDGVDEEDIDPEEERRLVRKIDWIIIPSFAVSYMFFFVDKTTLSYAAVFGIKEDLHLTGTDYSWLSSLFYFGFLAWAMPTNLLLQRLPASAYLGTNIFLWGILLMAQAASKNFATMAALRILSGAAEAGADPAFILITSMWYTRKEQPLKIGLWYTAVGIGIACGGLLGYAIGHIKGALASWKYEFLIIGAVCSAWGIFIALFLPNNPATARCFNDRERRIIIRRLRDNQTGVENKNFKGYQMLEAFTDFKSYFYFWIAFLQAVVNGGTTNFGTLITKGFGFGTLETTVLQVPYGAFIIVMILASVYINNKFPSNNRCTLLVIFLIPTIAGAFGLRFIPHEEKIGRLICYYLTGSLNASFVLLLSLQTGNTAGHTKKVVTSACLFLGYCVGNIVGPFFYKESQAPGYSLGIWSMICVLLIEVASVLLMRFALARENNRRDQLYGPRNASDAAFEDMTDRENFNFRYVY